MLLNKKIPISYIIGQVKWDFLYVLGLSLVLLYTTDYFTKTLPEMPLTIPAFIGTAISILLSFKISQSYDRWWEARKVWGAIVNDSRSFTLQLQAFTKGKDDAKVQEIAHRHIAWCYCLGQTLRGQNPLAGLEQFLTNKDLEVINDYKNKPLALLQLQTADILKLRTSGTIEVFEHIQLDNTLVRLCDSQGKCERIKGTIFPVVYRNLLHAIIYLFVATLSISLRGIAGFFEIPLLLLISSAFFLLEKSASHMQDPFEDRPTDTAVTAIARNIEINIRQLLQEKNIPEPYETGSFYLK